MDNSLAAKRLHEQVLFQIFLFLFRFEKKKNLI